MKKIAYPEHFNILTGALCHCPFGRSIDPEHLGKTAAKIDWLRDRPDMQTDEGKKILDYLSGTDNQATNYLEADKLLPWMVREWKKKRLRPHPYYPKYLTYAEDGEPLLTDEDGGIDYGAMREAGRLYNNITQFPPLQATQTTQALEDMKKHGKGIDVMQHKAHELFPKVKEFLNWQKEKERPDYGEVLHRFNDGWTIRRLQNPNEARIEGEDMGHCVGGPSYCQSIEDGRSIIASLRDAKNLPHATIDLTPDHWKDPETGDIYQRGERPEGRTTVPQVGPGSLVSEFYGKEDSYPLPEYEDRVNEWLAPHGIRAEGTGEDEEAFEPWWPEYFDAYGPTTLDEFMTGVDSPEELAPDDYHSACSDADEHGLDFPDLYIGEPDAESIFDDMMRGWNPRTRQTEQVPYDPEKGTRLLNAFDNMERYGHPYWGSPSEIIDSFGQELQDRAKNSNHFDPTNYGSPQEAKEAWEKSPFGAMYDHLAPWFRENGYWGDEGYSPWNNPGDSQQVMFHESPYTGEPVPWTESPTGDPYLFHQVSKTASRPPLYYRWVFSPNTGVTLSSNEDDHPALVPYHQDLGGQVNDQGAMHGYAYRIGNGWRLTDWEHNPVDDPFIRTQVLRKLGIENYEKTSSDVWEPVAYNWDRTHYGLPEPI